MRMSWLETKIPPPIVMALLGAAAYAASHFFPIFSIAIPLHTYLAIAFGAVGAGFDIFPALLFRRAGTTVNPLTPANTTQLVTTGIYRCTRNPMYVGQALMLFGWTLYLHNVLALAAMPLLVLYITRFQILPEERFLLMRFPDTYPTFCKRSPRWL